MADLTITAASVIADPDNSSVSEVLAGAALVQGEVVYKDAADSQKAKLADNNDTVEKSVVAGICLVAVGTGQPALILTEGDITIGAALTVGEQYGLSANAGKICPMSDVGATKYVSFLGIAISTTVLRVQRINTQLAHG